MGLVIVGLGNPGRAYAKSRHNAGFQAVDCIARHLNVKFKHRKRNYALARAVIEGRQLALVKPLTFMNDSGEVIKPILGECNAEISDLLVVCDTMDLNPGASRLRLSGASAGNKGLASILRILGTEEVKRIYLGVGRPLPGVSVIRHVLGRLPSSSLKAVTEAVERLYVNIDVLLALDYERAMNLINHRGTTF